MATPPGTNKKKKNPQKKKPDRMVVVLMSVFAVLAVAIGVVGFIFVRNLIASWTVTDVPGAPLGAKPTEMPEGYVPSGTEYAQPLQSPEDLEPDPWDGKSRVNILIMGLDYRDWETGDVPRTDTMILFTLNPITRSAGMLTIPRDMWVSIPGFEYAKINTAYFLGEVNKLPGGGPALAVKTVEQFLGVPINFYAQIDFNSFVQFIDEIGGITLNIKEEIKVDPIGPGNTVILEPGVQPLDGAVALAYARNRYTEGDDFDRSKRQIEVIMAIRDKVLNVYSLPKLITKAPALYQNLSTGIKTNLSLQQAIQLAWLIKDIPQDSIKRAGIGPDQVTFGTSPDNLAILKPIPDKIRVVRDEVFAEGGPLSPAAVSGDSKELVADEKARISVQNGTYTEGLATMTGQYLSSQGLNVTEETNAADIYNASELIIYNGKPYTIKYLSELMGIPSSRIYNQYDPDTYVDLVVILGNDWAQNNPMQ
jgi:LCP family protein required for cell wall assembly